MKKHMERLKEKKGFTLIELIVVVAIIAILVLLGAPRLMSYTKRAQMRHIQHDVKVMEQRMDTLLTTNKDEVSSWDDNMKNLNMLALADALFETEGQAKKVIRKKYYRETEVDKLSNDQDNPLWSDKYREYKVIPNDIVSGIKSQLPGTFYSNEEGKVYYEPDKPLTGTVNEEIECLAPTPESLDYEFDHKTGTIVKYHGNLQHLVIPAQFKVDKVCYPVLIIGRGAFAQGSYEDIVIPEGVTEIEDGAFADNENLERIEIPSTVDKIGDDVFKNTPNLDDIIIRQDKDSPDKITIPDKEPDYVGDDIIIDTKPRPDSNRPTTNPGGNGSTSGREENGFVSNDRIVVDKESGTIVDYNGNEEEVIIPDKIIVDGEEIPIKKVEESAYQGKGLITVVMPNGLERIEDYAFAGNQLIAAWIPDTVNYVGNYAFAYNELRKIKGSGPSYIPTIKSITVKGSDYYNDLNERGEIKTTIPGIEFKDFVFVTHEQRHRIETGGSITDSPSGGGSSDKDEITQSPVYTEDEIQNMINNKGYQAISNPEELQAIEDNPGKKYIQTNNIDMSGVENFRPIGNSFSGTYDGGGFSINGLTINGESYVGLFKQIISAKVLNTHLRNADITGTDSYTGGIAGLSRNSTINDSSAIGNINGNKRTGGLVGYHSDVTNRVDRATGSFITNSYTKGTITGDYDVGGLVGFSVNSNVRSSYSTANIVGRQHVGALIGEMYNVHGYKSTLTDSYGLEQDNLGLVGSSRWDNIFSGSSQNNQTNNSELKTKAEIEDLINNLH